jgi:hypothetical protein
MTGRAWEAALQLIEQYPDRLTVPQQIVCRIAIMAGPDMASLLIIPLAVQIMGVRR